MKKPFVNRAQRWVLMFCLLHPLHGAAAPLVELTAEVDFTDWDYWLFKDRINNDPGQSHLMLPSLFTTNSTVRCVVGLNTWMLEFDSENARTTYRFTGTNIIVHTVITKEIPGRPRVGEQFTQTYASSDGNPGRPVHEPDIMGLGSICWLSFCSGAFLKSAGRQVFPPNSFWKESSLVYSGWSDKVVAFEDGLGLPKSLDLIATNNQPMFQYQVHKSTNVLGWNFPLEFYCVQYFPAGTNHWKLALTVKGRVISIKAATKPAGTAMADNRNDAALSTNLHRFIVSRAAGVTEATMSAYRSTIPGTNITYDMVPIRGGEFVLGSAGSEPGRRSDEGPQRRVRIEPFWMGACEVTWNEYEIFLYRARGTRRYITVDRDPYTNTLADAVAMPSMPYVELSMGMGREGYPAVNITQHAANKYCQWLSALTGHYYRIPTEAEWEYACRADTTNRFSFGDDEKQLQEYAWFSRNSDFKYQKVGRKKPNPWDLYDMHGNVAEWTLDGYDARAYEKLVDGVVEPFVRAIRPYPHSVRGGSWRDDATQLRSASRQFSEPKWKEKDPSLPKSAWHMVDADFVGFRIVRPLRIPPADEMHRAWNNGVQIE